MANSDLESFFDIILEAKKGESVRDAIINAAKSLRKMTSNAGSLEGNTPDYFATHDRFETLYSQIIDRKISFDSITELEDSDYAYQSENIVTSATLYGVVSKHMKPAFHTISHYLNDPNDSKEAIASVYQYIKTIQKVKNDIRKSIKAKGKSVNSANSFKEYADIIRTIGDEDPGIVDDYTFTKNKEYDASEEQHTTDPYVFSSFKVNLDKTDLLVKGSGDENGKTYTPPEGKLFSSFDVKVKTSSGNASKISANNKKRGTSSDGSEELLDGNGCLKEYSITENGTYTGSQEGVEGFATLSVHVTEPKVEGKEFKVTFMNGGDTLGDPVTVEAYGNAYYEGETPVNQDDSSLVFSGWVPTPVRVIKDMECQAFFKEPTPAVPGEIQESWEEIVACRGDKYDIGAYKSLNLGTINNRTYGTLIFEKVYEGESSSTSTWLSKTLISSGTIGSVNKWPNSVARNFLQGTFQEDLARIEDGKLILDAVVPVRKYTICQWPGLLFDGDDSYIAAKTTDEFWIPSAYEIFGIGGSKDGQMYQIGQLLKFAWDYYNQAQEYEWNEPFYPSPTRSFEISGEDGFPNLPCYARPAGGTVYFSYSEDSDRAKIYLNTEADWSWAVKQLTDGRNWGYTTRSIAGYGAATGSPTKNPNLYSVGNTGLPSYFANSYSATSASYYPIGFCL